MEDRKTVLLAEVGDILYINGVCEDDENFYSCSYKSPKTGTEIGVRVPVRACIESDRNDVDFECVSANKRQGKEAGEYKELVSLNFEADYSYVNVWVHVKKVGLVRVIKTTKKSVHFIDENGESRYTAVKNVKSIYNYSPDKEMPTKENQKKQKREAKKSVNKAESPESNPAPQDNKEAETKSKKIASATPAANTDEYEYIREVPKEIDYKDRHVFIDIDENKKGMKVRRSHGGRVFWDNPKTGQYSAISLKKVNSNENIVVYEYK